MSPFSMDLCHAGSICALQSRITQPNVAISNSDLIIQALVNKLTKENHRRNLKENKHCKTNRGNRVKGNQHLLAVTIYSVEGLIQFFLLLSVVCFSTPWMSIYTSMRAQ